MTATPSSGREIVLRWRHPEDELTDDSSDEMAGSGSDSSGGWHTTDDEAENIPYAEYMETRRQQSVLIPVDGERRILKGGALVSLDVEWPSDEAGPGPNEHAIHSMFRRLEGLADDFLPPNQACGLVLVAAKQG